MLKWHKQYACIAVRGENATGNVRMRYLQVLKHQGRLNGIKKGMRENFTGCKKLRKVKHMYLEVKLKEAKLA